MPTGKISNIRRAQFIVPLQKKSRGTACRVFLYLKEVLKIAINSNAENFKKTFGKREDDARKRNNNKY